MAGILEGIRVVDWTVYQVGPFASAMLGDLGADVIHVEEPARGDPIRGNQLVGGLPLVKPGGRNMNFEEHNRNKRGIAIDLKKPSGRAAMHRLIAKSDIFVTNVRQAAIDKLGMDYETLRKLQPTLIYAHASGYGEKGPMVNKGSLDILGRARSGFSMAGGIKGDPPVYISTGAGDRIVSLHLVYGILAALHAKDKWGIGQKVMTSQLGSLVSIQGFCVTISLFQDVPKEFPRQPALTRNPMQNYYRTRDGKWMLVGFAEAEGRRWTEFWNALGQPDLVNEPKFASYESRAENNKELIKLLSDIFATRTQKEWEEIFANTDSFVTGCLEMADLQHDEQVLANDYITEWDHPALGPIKFVGFPVTFSENPPEFRLAAPEIGQHTEEVLQQIGYDWDEIVRLRDEGAIP